MPTTNLKPCRTNNTYILIYYCIVQRHFTHLITFKLKLLRFFPPSSTLKRPQERNLKCHIFIQHFFKIILYWCLDLIRHNIGTQLKLNKYIFDISIPFCLHLQLKAMLRNLLICPPSCLHVSKRSISYVGFDWLFIFRVRIAKNVDLQGVL